ERDEISQRPQRRDRRLRDGIDGAARADREGAAPGRHRDGSASGVRAGPRAEDAADPRRAAQRQRGRRGGGSGAGPPRQHGLLPGIEVASGSRDRAATEARLRGHGVLRSRRQLRARRADVRPPAGDQARREPGRRRKSHQHAGPHVAVGPYRRAAPRRRRHARHAPPVGRSRGFGGPDRGCRSGDSDVAGRYFLTSSTSLLPSTFGLLPSLASVSCARKSWTSSPSFAPIASPGRSPNFSRNARIGTTALAIARWPPALPISEKYRRTNSPAFFV